MGWVVGWVVGWVGEMFDVGAEDEDEVGTGAGGEIVIEKEGSLGAGCGHKAENRVPLWSWAVERMQGR